MREAPGLGAGGFFPLSAGMDGLAPPHSRVRLSVTMTGGPSENDDGEAGRWVKWLVIRYLLATWHKRNRALGILNEPVSLDQIARVPPEPRCVVLEGIPQRQLVPQVHQCRTPGAGWVTPTLGLKKRPDLKSSFPQMLLTMLMISDRNSKYVSCLASSDRG